MISFFLGRRSSTRILCLRARAQQTAFVAEPFGVHDLDNLIKQFIQRFNTAKTETIEKFWARGRTEHVLIHSRESLTCTRRPRMQADFAKDGNGPSGSYPDVKGFCCRTSKSSQSRETSKTSQCIQRQSPTLVPCYSLLFTSLPSCILPFSLPPSSYLRWF